MINNFDQLIEQAKNISQNRKSPIRVAVAAGNDKAALEAIHDAKKMRIADGVLVGDKKLILRTLNEFNINANEFEIIHAQNESEICRRTVQTIHDGDAVSISNPTVSDHFLRNPSSICPLLLNSASHCSLCFQPLAVHSPSP